MTALQALTAATRTSAEALMLPELGTLAKGKLADMVVLDGDPLADLETLRQPLLVYKEGQLMFKRPGSLGDSSPRLSQPGTPVTEQLHPQDHVC